MINQMQTIAKGLNMAHNNAMKKRNSVAELAISITTCPRENPTRGLSMRSLLTSLTSLCAEITTFNDDNKELGAFGNFNLALEGAIAKGTDYVLVLPDDLEYTAGWDAVAREKIENTSVGYIALFCPNGLGERLHFSRGWNQVRGGWATSWGGAYLMRRAIATKVINHDFYQAHLNGTLDRSNLINYAPNKRIDHVIPEVIHQLGLSQYFYAPSLAKHIGYTSTIGHTHRPEDEPFNL